MNRGVCRLGGSGMVLAGAAGADDALILASPGLERSKGGGGGGIVHGICAAGGGVAAIASASAAASMALATTAP
jgi:hypothetical protein